MKSLENLGLAALRCLDAETAHNLALRGLSMGLSARRKVPTGPALRTTLAGLELPNPIGLAAGLDKNAVALPALLRAGFGFVEIGAVTPRPQTGNPKPRLFRLTEDHAIINRMGFNNDGMEAVAQRLAKPRPEGIVGINLGANKDSEDRAADYAAVLSRTGQYVDFATINVSSPNTERLCDLQGKAALAALLTRVQEANAGLACPVPLFLKVAPDLDTEAIDDIAETILAANLDALIATNTTITRPETLRSKHASEQGGLSGAPLKPISQNILSAFVERLGGRIPIVSAGGIASGADAAARLNSGAAAIQLYSALIFQGFGLVEEIANALSESQR